MAHRKSYARSRTASIVPIGFARHVREALPAAAHLELDCGHVPQLEAPRATHAAVRDFLVKAPLLAPAGRSHDARPA
jgi:pimeloyl-ACP methyl ester carboxylesterase